MHPYLLSLGTFTLGTYGVIYAASYLLAVEVWYRLSRREGIAPESVLAMAFTCMLSGVLGAKLLMVIVTLADGVPVAEALDPSVLLHSAGFFHGAVIGGHEALLVPGRAAVLTVTPGKATIGSAFRSPPASNKCPSDSTGDTPS